MFKNFLSFFTNNIDLPVSNSDSFAQSKNDWSAVEKIVDAKVAVKTIRGTKCGIVKSVNANSIVLMLKNKQDIADKELKINKNEVKKILQYFHSDNQQTNTGALI